jgi:heme exporter protein D
VEDFTAFLNMGGYAAFVWPSLGIATLVLASLAIASIRRLRHSESALAAAEAASPVRRRRAEARTETGANS